MIGNIFFNVLMQLIYFVGVVFLLGFLISLLNRFFYSLCNHSRGVCYATGVIGTPVHELGHALMALLFGHKIEEIKLFQIDDESGVLGYVRHSYNRKNLYQVTGNYFIGVAPIVCGSLVVFFSMYFFAPIAYTETAWYLEAFSSAMSEGFSGNVVGYIFSLVKGIFSVLFLEISTFKWWIFIIIAMCIALHMNLSGADIKSALGAIPILAVVLILLNFILGYLTGSFYLTYLGFVNKVGGYLIGVLSLSLILSLLCVAVAAAVKGILRLVFRR